MRESGAWANTETCRPSTVGKLHTTDASTTSPASSRSPVMCSDADGETATVVRVVELAVVPACRAELLHDASNTAANPTCATRCMAHHLHEILTPDRAVRFANEVGFGNVRPPTVVCSGRGRQRQLGDQSCVSPARRPLAGS